MVSGAGQIQKMPPRPQGPPPEAAETPGGGQGFYAVLTSLLPTRPGESPGAKGGASAAAPDAEDTPEKENGTPEDADNTPAGFLCMATSPCYSPGPGDAVGGMAMLREAGPGLCEAVSMATLAAAGEGTDPAKAPAGKGGENPETAAAPQGGGALPEGEEPITQNTGANLRAQSAAGGAADALKARAPEGYAPPESARSEKSAPPGTTFEREGKAALQTPGSEEGGQTARFTDAAQAAGSGKKESPAERAAGSVKKESPAQGAQAAAQAGPQDAPRAGMQKTQALEHAAALAQEAAQKQNGRDPKASGPVEAHAALEASGGAFAPPTTEKSDGAQPHKGDGAPKLPAPFEQVSRRLGESLARGDGQSSFQMKLKPEGLGDVHVTFRCDGAKVTLEIVTQTALAQKLLENQSGDLKAALGAKNYLLDRLSIDAAAPERGGQFHDLSGSGYGAGRQKGQLFESPGQNAPLPDDGAPAQMIWPDALFYRINYRI